MDNVHFTGKNADFRQQLSDEICRLITEPDPHVEMRKLYSTNTVLRVPVRPTLAVTAIQQPFYNADLIQRAAIFELESLRSGHDSEWTSRQMSIAGGRTGWVAHHLAVIHRFLDAVHNRGMWNENYRAKHRLANYEQCLVLVGQLIGMPTDWIPQVLSATTQGQITEADWVHKGLSSFVEEQQQIYPKNFEQKRYTVKDICNWMQDDEQFSRNDALVNPWKLGRYMNAHRQYLAQTIGLYQDGKKANAMRYGIYRKT